MGVRLKRFVNRIRFSCFKRYEQFIITFAITYFITILFTLLVVFNYFEDVMLAKKITGGIGELFKSSELNFSFGYCELLDAKLYLVAKIIETLIPTTLTFSGTILMLQTTSEKSTSLNAILFIALSAFAMVGNFFMVSRLKSMLELYIVILFVLFGVVFVLSAKLFILQNKEKGLHKKEESDGKITG